MQSAALIPPECANVCSFVSGAFDLFNAMCEQHHRTVLRQFQLILKKADVNDKCKRAFNIKCCETLSGQLSSKCK